MSERGWSGGGRCCRAESTLREAGGGDKLARCTEDAEGGEPLRLGGYVCEESSDRRGFFAGPCASISRFIGVAMTSPSASLSSLLSSSGSLDGPKIGLRSAGAGGKV